MIQHVSNKIQNAIQKELFGAQKSIKIAVAWFTNDLLFQPLLLKLQAGVSVEIILNDDDVNHSKEEGLDFVEFINLGGILRWNKSKQLMHQKFCIIDDKVVISGSYNWTNKAEYNDELISIYKDETPTIEFYNDHFSTLQKKYKAEPKPVSTPKPKEPEFEDLSTDVTDEDLANAWTDEYGVMYSDDGKRVLKASKPLKGMDYEIIDDTLVICDGAFQTKELHGITLPNSVKKIGAVAFANNDDMVSCNIPSSVYFISENNPWGGCFNIERLECDSPLYTIRDGVLYSSDYQVAYGLIYWKPNISIDKRTRKISANAFWSNRKSHSSFLKSIDLANVIRIGGSAFEGCKGLSSIVIPEGVAAINEETFSGCESLVSICLPNSVSRIGKSAFIDCKSLKNLDIPNSVTIIEDDAFSGCGLTSIIIPDSVKELGEFVFGGCEHLNMANTGNGISILNDGVFFGCSSLKSLIIGDKVTTIKDSDDGVLDFCDGLVSVTIGKGLRSIDPSLFFHCYDLKHIEVKRGNHTFDSRNNCNAIIETKSNTLIFGCMNTNIPNSITHIGERAFSHCVNLTSITIPDSVTSIGERAFADCIHLVEINLSNNLEYIGKEAFKGCTSLKEIQLPESLKGYHKSDLYGLNESTFEDCTNLKKVVLPPNYEKALPSRFFKNCQSLKEIIIPKDIFAIEKECFAGCINLQFVTFPLNPFRIGESAFCGCKSLVSIDVHQADSFESYAFKDCSSLKHVNFPLKVSSIARKLVLHGHSEYNPPYGIGVFANCRSLESAYVCSYENIWQTPVPSNMFEGCISLKTVVLEEGLQMIGEAAFKGCVSLEEIDLPHSLSRIEGEAFKHCTFLFRIASRRFKERSFFTDKECGIRGGAILCNLQLEKSCFENCKSLTWIDLHNCRIYSTDVFKNCNNLIRIEMNIHDSGEHFDYSHMFEGLEKLTSLKIFLSPNREFNFTKFQLNFDSCFKGCKSLAKVWIHNRLNGFSIGKEMFSECTNLQVVKISPLPSKDNHIKERAFYNCSSLKQLEIHGDIEIAQNAFEGCPIKYP